MPIDPTWASIIRDSLYAVEFVMEAVTFAQFIMEEALQTAFFAVKNAMDHKQYDLAKMTLDFIDDEALAYLDTFNENIGWLAPYSKPAFAAYAKSCHHMRNTYRAALNCW